MVIKFSDVLFENDKYRINLEANKNEILGVVNYDFADCFKKNVSEGKISFGRFIINNKSTSDKKDKIKNLVEFDYIDDFLDIYVLSEIKRRVKNINMDELNKYIKLFSLKDNILNELCVNLSNSEKRKISIICSLMSDKEVIFLDNPSKNLDDTSKEKLIRELKRAKKNKIIIINSNDTEFLIKVANNILLKSKDNRYIFEKKFEVLSQKELLNDINLCIPNIINFISRVYELKGIKLMYRDNLNDTVKDVYRNA